VSRLSENGWEWEDVLSEGVTSVYASRTGGYYLVRLHGECVVVKCDGSEQYSIADDGKARWFAYEVLVRVRESWLEIWDEKNGCVKRVRELSGGYEVVDVWKGMYLLQGEDEWIIVESGGKIKDRGKGRVEGLYEELHRGYPFRGVPFADYAYVGNDGP
jgi:hypothetical protein